jgi:hypothetical protein
VFSHPPKATGPSGLHACALRVRAIRPSRSEGVESNVIQLQQILAVKLDQQERDGNLPLWP